MNRMYSRVRNSLAIKVIFSTVLLSLVVTGITGSVLNTQLSAGVKDVNLSSALVEARSTIFTAEYRFLLAQGEKDSVVQKVVDDVISSATTLTSNENAREVVFLRSPGNTRENNYEIASNLLDPTSIPSTLSERVRKNPDLVYQYTNMNYLTGTRIKGLAIGQKVQIPNAGQYEMYIIFSLANQEKTLDLISRSLFLGGFILLLLIALITWLVTRQVVSPVREAAMIAAEFTAGDFRKRLKVESQDEISTLGLAFNDMAESIEKQIARLENLSRVQQRFVSDVSHELRTPLTTLRMASEVIYSSKEGFDPVVARSAELLVAQLDRFEKLLEDLLEVSRFDAEVAVLEAVDFDMVQLVQRCADDLSLVAKERKTEIYVNSSEPVIMIKADIRRVERILRNLLANAIDHSEELQIDVRIEASEHDVAVGVRDYGIGLDENALTRVFDRFWRADPSRARTRGGTGLGLSIALEDARLHNGELEAWGRPGRGSHFVVTLPRNTWESIEARLIKLQPEDYRAQFPQFLASVSGSIESRHDCKVRPFAELSQLIFPSRCFGCHRLGPSICSACRSSWHPHYYKTKVESLTVHSALLYTPTASKIILAAKESGLKGADDLLIEAIIHVLDKSVPDTTLFRLVPIPSSKASQRRRGRSFVVDLVSQISQRTGIPMIDCLQLSRRVLDQSGLHRDERASNLAGAFTLISPARGELILIDDVVTTGATLREAARALNSQGFQAIGSVTAITACVAQRLR